MHACPLLCQREWASTQGTLEPPGKPLKTYQAQAVPRTGGRGGQKLLGDSRAMEASRGAAQGGFRTLIWRKRHPRKGEARGGRHGGEGSGTESVSLVKHTSPSARTSGGENQEKFLPSLISRTASHEAFAPAGLTPISPSQSSATGKGKADLGISPPFTD